MFSPSWTILAELSGMGSVGGKIFYRQDAKRRGGGIRKILTTKDSKVPLLRQETSCFAKDASQDKSQGKPRKKEDKASECMRIMRILVAIGLICSVCCLSSAGDYTLVTNQEPRVNAKGITVLPPPGSSWIETINGDDIFYVKTESSLKTHSCIASAVVIEPRTDLNTPEDFLVFVKEKKEYNQDVKRYRNMKVDCALDDRYGQYCVKYHMVYEDHRAKNRGEADYLMVEVFGYTILHPRENATAIDIAYSERYKPGEDKTEWRNEGQAFLASLKFRPLGR